MNNYTFAPRATEKTYLESQKNTYVFPVDKDMSKQEIKAIIEKEYVVTVTDVRVLTRKGKKTKFSKGKHAYPGITFRRDKKFAYVSLKDGDKIPVFETEEESKTDNKKEKDSAKEATTKKVADKKAVKGDK